MSLRQTRFPRLLPNCLLEGLQIRDDILAEERMRVLYFGDLGPYGSESCKSCKAVDQLKQLLDKYRIKMTYFLPSKFDMPPDSGFVAAVEMTVISHASHVILIGGGAFQSQVELLYQENQLLLPNDKQKNEAFKVCSTERQAQETTNRFSPHEHHPSA